MAFDIKTATPDERKKEYKRIAAEMGDDSFFTKKEMNHLPDAMNEGEQLLGFASGLMDNNTWLIALTDKRILLLDKGMFYGLSQTEFTLSNVSAVSYETGLLMGKLVIQVASVKHTITQVPKKAVSSFAERTRRALTALNSSPISSTAPQISEDDIVSKLERLANLRDRGILDDAEFADQKAKILSAQ
ncbi:PH domain-containing protein [Vreelandella profundi]|uniref:PH domain-containing protein n=1 Tax=Vreelandella profundi TaxID=2852117 RepID=UPI001F479452|nr:PH domain-containing protein [Halomonas profundi]